MLYGRIWQGEAATDRLCKLSCKEKHILTLESNSGILVIVQIKAYFAIWIQGYGMVYKYESEAKKT